MSAETPKTSTDSAPPNGLSPTHKLGLHREGISISCEKTFLIQYDGLDVIEIEKLPEEPLACIEGYGVVGMVTLGPGYLVFITQQTSVFEHHDTTIWNIKKSLVIPLKYTLAKESFKYQEPVKSKENEPVTPPKKIADELTEKKDMLFSKMGVYVNDLRSNASLALSPQKVNQKVYDVDGSEMSSSSSETINDQTPETTSFKLNRAITIKGMPKKLKDNPLSFLEKAKMKKYDQLGLDTHVSTEMLYKYEKQLGSFFSSGDFYYSGQLDITKPINFENETLVTPAGHSKAFLYNAHISEKLPPQLRLSVIQGFVKTIPLTLTQYTTSKKGQLLLISKRSTHRAGSRYLRRGIDDQGHVANFVITSQYLLVESYYSDTTLFTRFDIMRGSIPIFFQQDPSKLKPVPYLTRPVEKCKVPFVNHFEGLKSEFGDVACVNLVERSKKERVVGDAYESLCKEFGIGFDWFDFHEVCKKMRFDRVRELLEEKIENVEPELTVEETLVNYGWYDPLCAKTQCGIFRVNCVDCLDRTNLVQKFMAEFILVKYILEKYCLETDGAFQSEYNNLWADNGDYISKQYSSTNALKGDFTRTSKRSYKGLLNDGVLTLSRYYSGYVSDYFKQCFIDYLHGHQNEDIFEEYESTLNVLDPNEISEQLSKKNTSLQNIIAQLNFDDDLILIGSWFGFQSPMEWNTLKLKGMDLKTVCLILTNKKLFVVQFDEASQQIVKCVVLEIGDVVHLEYGTYILSTHNALALNPRRNVGMKLFVKSGDAEEEHQYFTFKFPQDMEYNKVKHIIDLVSKTCHSSTLESKDIMTSKEASTKVIDVLEYRFKKLVWG